MTSEKRFRGTVSVGARGRTFIFLPFDPGQEWGEKTRHYVAGAVNGVPYRGSLVAGRGQHYLPLRKPWRDKAGIGGGEEVEVTLAPDPERKRPLPYDLEETLAASPDLHAAFDRLSPEKQEEYARRIRFARGENRVRRLHQVAHELEAERDRLFR